MIDDMSEWHGCPDIQNEIDRRAKLDYDDAYRHWKKRRKRDDYITNIIMVTSVVIFAMTLIYCMITAFTA